ncbi:MAG: TIGR03013 family PEP-CTERM/XrtA system glycosyltransferase [Geobacteraceae bacterium]|nr:TIGR03013 family PEP-CTERM/XrtA system glycosyltransferase [Geobacteraceae bacterium]
MRIFIQLVLDFLLAAGAIQAACRIRPVYFSADGELYFLTAVSSVIFGVAVVFSSFLIDVYDDSGKFRKREILARVMLAGLTSCLPIAVVYMLAPGLLPEKKTVLVGILLFSSGQFLLRLLLNAVKLPQRIFILGTGNFALEAYGIAANSAKNIEIVGFVSCLAESEALAGMESRSGKVLEKVDPSLVIGDAENLPELVQQLKADAVLVALSERRGVFPVKEMLLCKMRGSEILDVPTFYEQTYRKLMLEQITPSWFLFSSGFRRTTIFVAFKRFLDIVLALIGLAFTLPFFPLIAIIIKLDSPGPLFFSQIRTGLYERTFRLYKFRTMRQDAEKGTGAVWSTENDPRITKVGAFLRKSRIDEFPQFYNVLRGDMSFVGPRPERPEFVEKLKLVIPYYSKRHFVKPGLTGWAQVCYPYGSTVEDAVEKLRYDLYYTKNLSPFLDLLIVLETIKVVIFGRGGR